MYTVMIVMQLVTSAATKEKHRINSETDGYAAMTSITAIVPSAEILTNPQTMNTRMTAIKTAISAAMSEQMRRINPARNG